MPTTRKRVSRPLFELNGEQRAGMEVERLREAEPDLGLVPALQSASLGDRRRFVPRVVGSECDELERFAEVERIGRERVVARRCGDDPGQPPHSRQFRRRRGDGDLVRAADRLRLAIQARQERRDREDEQRAGCAHGEHGDRRRATAGARKREAHAQTAGSRW
jgi:hypothetical protein